MTRLRGVDLVHRQCRPSERESVVRAGRDHKPNGFAAVLTGAGVKRGVSYDVTDELGFTAVENLSSVHDLHAQIRSPNFEIPKNYGQKDARILRSC